MPLACDSIFGSIVAREGSGEERSGEMARTTTITLNIHPGDRPRVVVQHVDATIWMEIRDEDDNEVAAIFINSALLTALRTALAQAEDRLSLRHGVSLS